VSHGGARLVLSQDRDLARCFRKALRCRQRANVEQADRRAARPRRELTLDDRLGLGRCRKHVESEQGGAFGARIGGARALRERQRLDRVVGREPAAADGDQRRRLGLGHFGERQQGALDQRRGRGAIGRASEKARHCFERRGQRRTRRLAKQSRQGLVDFGDAVERDQQLDLVAQRVLRIGHRLAPGDDRGEGLLARACLRRDLGRAPEQLLVLGSPCRVEHQLIRGAGLAVAKLDLAEQQLVEERRVEGRVLDRRGNAIGGRGDCRDGASGDQRERGGEGPARG